MKDKQKTALDQPAPVQDRMMRPRPSERTARRVCATCNGEGETNGADCIRCKGVGVIAVSLMILMAMLGSCFAARGATVTGLVSTAGSNPYATNILFIPWSTPLVSGNSLIASASTNVIADSNGAFSVTLKAGDYRVNVGQLQRDTFWVSVPTNSATYNITTLITNALTYTFRANPSYLSSADAANIYLGVSNIFGTNGITVHVTGSTVVVSNTSSGGGGGGVDGSANSNLTYAVGLANSNLSYAIGTAGTNYALGASNAVRNFAAGMQTGSFPLSNFLAMGVSNIVGGPGIRVGTNNGTLTFTNTVPVPLTWYVNPVDGVDATSALGDPARPAKTFGHAVSNVVNNGAIVMLPGTNQVKAHFVLSNGFGGINFIRKTNVTVMAYGGVIHGTNLGDVLYVTNCHGLHFHGLTVKGTVLTNWATAAADGGLVDSINSAGFGFYGGQGHTIQFCTIIDHNNQGLSDLGGPHNAEFCTNVIARFNYLGNIGNMRTNIGIPSDGTAITGGFWWWIEHNMIVGCLRGIEPYVNAAGSAATGPCFARYNILRNFHEFGILTGSSTNIVNSEITGNILINDQGWTFPRVPGGEGYEESAGIVWQARHGKISQNWIQGRIKYGIYVPWTQGPDQLSDLEMSDNWLMFLNGYRASGDSTSRGIMIGDFTDTYASLTRIRMLRNFFHRATFCGIQIHGVKDSLVKDNIFSDVHTGVNGAQPAIYIGRGSAVNSNIVLVGNTFHQSDGVTTSALDVDAGNKAISFIDNWCSGLSGGIIVDNAAGAELYVRFLPKSVRPAFTAGVYVNAQDDTDITLGPSGARTNMLATPFNGHRVRVRDGSANITNIVLMTSSGVINGGNTNVGTNYGASVLIGDGTNFNHETTVSVGGIGSGLATNANQFGASTTLTIKAGANQTNANFFSAGTNHGPYYVEGTFNATGAGYADTLGFGDNAIVFDTFLGVNYCYVPLAFNDTVTLTAGPMSALLRTTADGLVSSTTVGTGLSFDGTTLSASGSSFEFAKLDGTNSFALSEGGWHFLVNEDFTGDGTSVSSDANKGTYFWGVSAAGTTPSATVPAYGTIPNANGIYFGLQLTQANSGRELFMASAMATATSLTATGQQVFVVCRFLMTKTNTSGEQATFRFGLVGSNGSRTDPSAGIYVRTSTNANNGLDLVTSRSSSAQTNWFPGAGLQQKAWTNAGFWLDGTGTNVVMFMGGSLTNLVSVRTNNLKVPDNTWLVPWFNTWKLTATAGNDGHTNLVDWFRVYTKPN